MSKSVLRKDKTCLNCRHVVDQRFCPNCGQENTDSRKTFHHLFIHFFEDLTHYENAFWRTIRNLLFKPAALTKEYLSGKRLSYLAPVRLYIFISFITFFLIAVIPDAEDHLLDSKQTVTTPVVDKNGNKKDSIIYSKKVKLRDVISMGDSLSKMHDTTANGNDKATTNNYYVAGSGGKSDYLNFGYESLKELDSVRKFSPPSEMSDMEYWINKKILLVKENNTKQEIFEKFKASFVNNIPKVLFIYMPLFAFFLWLFHSKKRWYYFDHGIFTLHYFSFLLLVLLLLFLIDGALSFGGEDGFFSIVNSLIHVVGIFWMIYYFFPAHHRFYGESRIVSFIKSVMLFFINCFLISVILILFVVYTFINLH
jgi:uncharacterized protein DUF3667